MVAKRLGSLLGLFGIQPAKALQTASALGWFIADYRRFKVLHRAADSGFAMGKLYPCLGDREVPSGVASGHYFHQDLLVARRIFERRPRRHADIGSRIDGFVSHIAVFREIEVFDMRPLKANVRNIIFRQMDLMNDTDPELVGAYDSVSCLHALEHFGLGRYGDRLDYLGFIDGLRSISTLLCPGGMLYLSVPMGPQRIEFNAHRVFSLDYFSQIWKDEYRAQSFSYVDDVGDLHENVRLDSPEAQGNFDCHLGLAILELVKN